MGQKKWFAEQLKFFSLASQLISLEEKASTNESLLKHTQNGFGDWEKCVCMCVCVKQIERERERERGTCQYELMFLCLQMYADGYNLSLYV